MVEAHDLSLLHACHRYGANFWHGETDRCTYMKGRQPQHHREKTLIFFLLLVFLPIAVSAARYFLGGDGRGEWQTADRSSAGLPTGGRPPRGDGKGVRCAHRQMAKYICCPHLDRGEGERGGKYSRYDYTAWGDPIRSDGFAPDGRWFGAMPETVAAIDGDAAGALVPKIRHVVETTRFKSFRRLSAWPWTNSNTFVQAALDAVPEMRAVLPPTAIGKNFPYDGRGSASRPPAQASLSLSRDILGLLSAGSKVSN